MGKAEIIVTNQICTKCIMDTTISDIKFDENGVCNFCELHKALEKNILLMKHYCNKSLMR